MYRDLKLYFIATSALVACQAPTSSGGVEPVTAGPTCSDCRLERTLLATINDAAFPGGAMGIFAQVQVNSDSTFLVLTDSSPINEGVYLADRKGSIHRRLGRGGEGPGEYQFAQYSMESPTSYLIVDQGLQRLTTISKKDLSVESTQQIPVGVSSFAPILFPDGTWVLPTHLGQRYVYSPILMNVISPVGELLRVVEVEVDTTAVTHNSIYYLSTAGETAFWVTFLHGHRMEKWDRSGHLIRAVERKGDWFHPQTPDSEDGDRFTRIKGASEDEDGRLWVHYEMGRLEEYEQSASNPDGSPTTITIMGSSRDPKDRGTRIEVIDLESLTVLASLDIPEWTAWPTHGNFHLSVNPTRETQAPFVEIWTVDLVGDSL